MRGKPRPAHVGRAVAEAHRGKSHSEATRQKMSTAHRRRGTRPPKAGRPWTEAEDALVRALPPAEVARQTGRTLVAVLHLPDLRKRGEAVPRWVWGVQVFEVLGIAAWACWKQ